MRRLLKNGTVINVFTGELEKSNVLIEDDRIIGVGEYGEADADESMDAAGMYICPGFIDGHIHIESTMLLPVEFARAAVPHGTTAVVADPHEIANVCGKAGIRYMLERSEQLPMTVYVMIPSCVPATEFDESGARLEADDIVEFYGHPRVLGLGEMMNYPGVLAGNPGVMDKIHKTLERGLLVNGHAPLLSGKALDAYIAAGISDDHECSSAEEAIERIRKGQRVMIRQGTAARNLEALLPLFDEPYASRCLLVTDDKHPADLLKHGHIDDIIRSAARQGKSAVTGIRMATLWAAEYFGLRHVGAVAPGYKADLVLLTDLEQVKVHSVYKDGVLVAEKGQCLPFAEAEGRQEEEEQIRHSFCMKTMRPEDFQLDIHGKHRCRVIRLVKGELLTEEMHTEVDFDKDNGIDLGRDILKIAVVERHHGTGHVGMGLISGIGLKKGAIASSVSHDAHNLIIVGTNEEDMAIAANRLCELGGGILTVAEGEIIAEMPLPYAGLMTGADAQTAARQNDAVRESVHSLGVPQETEPFMTTAFISLTVIPHIKITTLGLVDVDRQEQVPLVED